MIKADSAGSEPPIAGEVEFAKLGCFQGPSPDSLPTSRRGRVHGTPEGGPRHGLEGKHQLPGEDVGGDGFYRQSCEAGNQG